MRLSGSIPRVRVGRVPEGVIGQAPPCGKCFSIPELIQRAIRYSDIHKDNIEHQEPEIYWL